MLCDGFRSFRPWIVSDMIFFGRGLFCRVGVGGGYSDIFIHTYEISL